MVNYSTIKRAQISWGIQCLLVVLLCIFYSSLNAQTDVNHHRVDHTEQAAERKIVPASGIELSEFYGSVLNCYARLVWSTTLEDDFDYFELQWSEDGNTYEMIEIIEGAAGAAGMTYNFTDAESGNHNYYRLKMIDMAGNYSYSEVVYIHTGCEDQFDVAVHPNPVAQNSGVINVQFYAKERNALLIITDVNGNLVKQVNIGVAEEKSWNSMQMDISDLAPGMYFLNVPGSKNSRAFLIK